MKFVNVVSNQQLPFLEKDEDALDAASGDGWAVNNNGNEIDRQPAVAHADDGILGPIRRRRFFMHSREPGMIKVRAEIQNAETYLWFKSEGMGADDTLEMTGLPLPSFTRQSYSFVRTRVAGDDSPSDGDEFAYVDNSTDYWLLEYVGRDTQIIKFARLRIASAANKSSVLWASHLVDDRFVSYTGFSFQSDDSNINDPLLFDGLLYRMAKQRSHRLPKLLDEKGPGAGQLMLSLHRSDNFLFGDAAGSGYTQALEKSLLFDLIDKEGNEHPLRFEYGVEEDDARNGLAARDKLRLFRR
ncbi:hypothetical protein E6B08_08160 [Pseudomonas putida]|uniref:Uncharacterized protein n=1 Tax=Pseudomonas putida TaxID=303 RepID=A0A4D6X6U2_PSEPU|nr:hypothetical protein [Pseudomonas putida]QCI11372.1 hypothetical protein E6B08_08160 [Pseudomonas putida]